MKSMLRITFSTFALISSVIASTAYGVQPGTAECLDASEKSLTFRNQHKLREAREQLLTCSAASCPADIRDECIRRVGEVNQSMPTIVFFAKDSVGNDLVAVKVTMDGQTIADRLDGVALSIDPGEHDFTFEVAGQPPVQRKLLLREGVKNRQEGVTFGPTIAALPGTPAAPAGTVVVPQPQGTPPPTEGPQAGIGTQRIMALALAGAGVVGLGLGIGFGLEAMSKHDDAKKACPDSCADQNGVNLWNQASSAGNISTVGFIVGAAGLAGGAVLWLTARPASSEPSVHASTQVGVGIGSIQIRGAW
jgi:hypothetical protein